MSAHQEAIFEVNDWMYQHVEEQLGSGIINDKQYIALLELRHDFQLYFMYEPIRYDHEPEVSTTGDES